MPKIYKPDQRIHDYTVTAEVSRGMMALAYRARAKDGQEVFLKQYKSPTIQVAWYEEYKAYQRSLKRRIEESPCKNFCYRFMDVFEYERCFFQVFEFLDRSYSLEEVLVKCRKKPTHANEEQRLIMAKVLMGGMAALHQQAIVHSDLKPANIMLITDKSIAAGYRLRIIDMDFSLLVDQRAPWHGDRGYFGTPGYLSPEHLCGKVPQPASDVFTLGLMLHELLGKGHPYQFEDENQYQKACVGHSAKPIELFGSLGSLPYAAQIREAIHRCLTPEPSLRPTSMGVNKVLNGLATGPDADGSTKPTKAKSDRPTEVKPRNGRLILRSASGAEKNFNVPTPVGRHLIRPLGDDAKYFDDVQFALDKDDEGWLVIPDLTARNETFLNGKKITARTRLKEGDVLAVGNEARRVVKLPMTVGFGPTG